MNRRRFVITGLSAQYATFTMDGKRMKLRTYNGQVTGPTIVTLFQPIAVNDKPLPQMEGRLPLPHHFAH